MPKRPKTADLAPFPCPPGRAGAQVATPGGRRPLGWVTIQVYTRTAGQSSPDSPKATAGGALAENQGNTSHFMHPA